MTEVSPLSLDAGTYVDEAQLAEKLIAQADLSTEQRAEISAWGADLVTAIRTSSAPGLMEVFLNEYGLSTEEGVALMCLAEALLRVPDADTIDALIEDKIAPSDWGKHMGHSASPLVNASTWALMLTGKVLVDDSPGPAGHLRGAIRRLGEPVIRRAVSRAMKEMGRQFVLGETITSAMSRAAGMEARGYTYSYDMLGEAARTEHDASRYHLSYSRAIGSISDACNSDDIRANPGISVKLSALHPRYEIAQEDRVMDELVPRLKALALLAKSAKMGLNVDAEEADRLSLSLQVIETVLADPALAGWDGFGVVVQAYGPRCGDVIDTLYAMAQRYDRKLMVRLVKGAYWDTEVKRAQVAGMDGFPVITRKALTDVSYIANARKLLDMTDRIYPQFATHNAHTVAAILNLAGDRPYEFQRLHGMGETLHNVVKGRHHTRCRIYAPVGAHRDLLAYLVRRLLENGANSSFVNQVVDDNVPAETVAADPFALLETPAPRLTPGTELYAPDRRNSRGFDLRHRPTLEEIDAARTPFADSLWEAGPLVAADTGAPADRAPAQEVVSPATGAPVGHIASASPTDIANALSAATPWDAPAADRAEVLKRAADLYEENFGEIFALLAREAGKTLPDAVAELREAVDFLRYYANGASDDRPAAGRFLCISPWNFPLAIFTGQISAALAAGNAVIAKPAEQTPLIAHLGVSLMLKAGVPATALQLLPGDGASVGAALTASDRIDGVAFTGSTETAKRIRASMAEHMAPGAPLIAETGGLNAMIVDSTALPEQAVQAIVESAFQSAGQRCSALRCLYVQDDIADDFLKMLKGAMDALRPGDPWALSSDLGPVIDADARTGILDHVAKAEMDGRLVHRIPVPNEGHFVGPCIVSIPGIAALEREIFGPVLHVVRFKASEIDAVIEAVNATGYGLTFGLQTRIDDRVQHVTEAIEAGNVYVNRNQIGAIVGSQPFGGEGLSGTGPKAGGPFYLTRFKAPLERDARIAPPEMAETLPGPTGESNRLTRFPRWPFLCLGPTPELAEAQKAAVEAAGGNAILAEGLDPAALRLRDGIGGALYWGDEDSARAYAQALSGRDGPILPLLTGAPEPSYVLGERHLCVDTTAAGGNAALLSGMS
ncbi:bifunctional proline dehydrogenase/L-glutamate gamma-semialdehyde dehydrogenase PutA [Marinibacterium profundimaris]|uniref:Bifunctional protein PutA n=1 Tax=Marinibacterium profundimaris TaxID=1679460 RepID=A0A225NCC3_9RHOB|nr:bifunctional proline dehydrogenase/L-glutamate gamma-semialdehyde dehydrogenase PutA [Marinibacterium profundimaris]OWU69005.1 pyrroline-5-carboxylate dehydrogenase [Marinibacterium profundimaris]